MKLGILVWFVTAALLIALFSCGDSPTRAKQDEQKPAGKTPATEEVVPEIPEPEPKPGLWLIGNDQGRLRPCGCSKPLIGGIIRRSSFFESLDDEVRKQSLLIACGNMVVAGGRQQELKIEGFLEVLTMLEARVLLMADGDLQVGSRYWDDILAARDPEGYPLVSLNLARDGARLFDSHATLAWAGAPLIVTSWTSPDDNKLTEPGVEAQREPDLAAIKKALEAEGARLMIFTTADPPFMHDFLASSGLAEAAAETLVCWSGISDLPIKLERRDSVFVMETGTKGRYVGWTDWPRSEAIESFTLAKGDHVEARSIFDFYREGIVVEELMLQIPRFDLDEGEYAGSDECNACHEEAGKVWRGSSHAHAWQTLVDSGDDRDPECVGCHVVGWGETAGFDPIDRTPVDVQCEACHGPSRAHATDPGVPTPRGQLGSRACLRCHDLENSPKFDFDDYWPKIAHK